MKRSEEQGVEVPRRILVADDKPAVLALLQRILQGAGYEVLPVQDAAR